ncbi:MAG TPA: hypothetical protein VF676_09170 [Flavobacterium sp.]|jgi:hypothetical protein
MNHKLTIYTPIRSNYGNLDIIYDSLLGQGNKGFVWFIIDYGESESANSYVSKFKSDNAIEVKYLYMAFKGRYLATKHAFENIETDYILGLDGGYFIVKDCVEVILNQWQSIEKEKNASIAEIRALAIDSAGKLVGKSKYRYKDEHVDMSWHQMVLKKRNYYEMLACWDRRKFLECVDFNRYNLFSDHIDELSTTLFWSSLGRKYLTRYLNQSLKCKIDSQIPAKKNANVYNNFVSSYYFLVENRNYFFHSPKYYSAVIYSFVTSAINLKLSFSVLLKLNRSLKYRAMLMSYYWPAVLLKKIK